MFYEWGTVDVEKGAGDDELRKADAYVPRESFEGQIAKMVLEILDKNPDLKLAATMGGLYKVRLAKYLEMQRMRKNATGGGDVNEEGFTEDAIWWLLPDNWKRVFHPRPQTHALIARLIYEDLVSQQNQVNIEEAVRFKVVIAALGVFLMGVEFVLWLLSSRCQKKGAREAKERDGERRGLISKVGVERTFSGSLREAVG